MAASDLVNAATNENLKEVDWGKNIQICELVAKHHGQGKDVIKSVKKRLRSKNPNVQLFSVMLLEMLLNNCGEHIHMQIIDNRVLPLLVKIVKKKTQMPVEERIFLLLEAVQTLVGGASGKFPQYYYAYCDLVSAGVKFLQSSHMVSVSLHDAPPNGNVISSSIPETPSIKSNGSQKKTAIKDSPDYSIIQKATSVLEVLSEVLDSQHPELVLAANDEFTLDLVEQCSFQKQQIMHIVMNSRDENVVSQSIELNEKMHEILAKHKAIVSSKSSSGETIMNQTEVDVEEEEDPDSLLNRIRKGKACIDENSESSPVSIKQSNPRENPQRASTQAQPLCIKPQGMNGSSNGTPASSVHVHIQSKTLPFSIPPPPSKHKERERFFMEKQQLNDGSRLARHMNGVSLQSHNGSNSLSGSGSALQG